MKIEVPAPTVEVGHAFALKLDDQGSAMVAIKVEIFKGNVLKKEIFHAKTITGPKTEQVLLEDSGDYDCFVTIAATRTKSLGPTYDSSVTMIGIAQDETLLCSAEGSVPKGVPSDVDSEQLILRVP